MMDDVSGGTGHLAKQGRRAGTTSMGFFASGTSNENSSNAKAETQQAPPSKAIGGWGENGITTATATQSRTVIDDAIDDTIPVIPDLEEVYEEDQQMQIAVAPNRRVVSNRVATYKELDHDLLRHSAFLTVDNEIDMKLLTKVLRPLDDIVKEVDRPWDWDSTFTEAISEMAPERAGEAETGDNIPNGPTQNINTAAGS